MAVEVESFSCYVLYSVMLCCVVLCCIVLHRVVLYCDISFCVTCVVFLS